ncbi:Protein regulator of cytokinesis 1 [Fasciola hepatica]|uniref:Protein regulator of cytokinesis 1 n=1 Tax=Fasciola hepatica TaxID=6192 RepID=A0A4E0R0P7_FASHE|nr:Protein regulator of cytokinesis 1 [Fasciola hepatica]
MSSLDVLWIEKLNEKVSVKVKEICHIWAEIGIDGARLQARKESLQSYLFTMLDEMYDEEVAAQQTLVKSIKDLEVKVDELETELEFTAAPLGDSLSLVLKEKALFDRFKSLEERALSITETFNSLRNEEEQLSARLGEPTAVIFFKHVPNQQQMRSLKTNIDYLTMEKRSRVLHLSELRQDIVSIRAALESDTSLDADLLSRITQEDALDVLPLTAEFLAQVEALRQKCDSRLSEIESECINLTGEVLSLATRLNLEREEILDLEQPVSASFLKLVVFVFFGIFTD